MPQSKTFRSLSGGHVSIYVPWRPDPIELMEGGTYETSDQAELDALSACPEAIAVRNAVKNKPAVAAKSKPTSGSSVSAIRYDSKGWGSGA